MEALEKLPPAIHAIIDQSRTILSSIHTPQGLNWSLVLAEPTLQSDIQRLGVGAIHTLICGYTKIFLYKINLKQKMTELQVSLFVDDLIVEASKKDYRMYELIYFFNECAKSTFGKIYERIDAALLFDFLAVYAEWRTKDKDAFLTLQDRKLREAKEREQREQRLLYYQSLTPERIEALQKELTTAIDTLKQKFKPKYQTK